METGAMAEGIMQGEDARKGDTIRRVTTGSGRTIMGIREEKAATLTGTDMIPGPDRRTVNYSWQSN